MSVKIPCSVEILTRNSSPTLERCLESVKDFAEIIVLDGNSTDATRTIAEKYGCRIAKQYETNEANVSIKNYSEVRNKGLKLATYAWFMFIDSDEYLSKEAVEEIRSVAVSPNPSAYIWWQPRKYVLGGKIIECATTYPNRQVRFFHRERVKEFIRPIHERIEVKPGATTSILRNYEYVPLGSKAELAARWRRYTYTEAAIQRAVSPAKLLRLAFRQKMLFLFYLLRFLRNILFCRGIRMPLSYEWTRHKYLFILSWLFFRQAIKNLV